MSSIKKQSDKYLFDISNYKLIRNINTGGFGTVNLVQNKETNKTYAAKTNLIPNKTQNKLFISREIRILIQVQHPTIIQFRGFSYVDFNGNPNITILMDYMEGGSLADMIAKEQQGLCPPNYDNTKRQIILAGIARGMMILHSKHIIQRDLKPENVLLDSDLRPCITDFGLSKVFDPYHSMNQSMADSGTAAYMAPEVINSDQYNTKADVYSFGILMYEVIMGKRAYASLLHGKKKLNQFQFKKRVSDGLRPEIKPGEIKKSFQTLIEKCWSENPNERPTFIELYRKLSLSREDLFEDFDTNNPEPVIVDDDDDEDSEDELNITLNKKYCLDDVDFGEFLYYIDEISQEPVSAKDKEEGEMKEKMNKMEEEISSLKAELAAVKSSKGGVDGELVKKMVDDQIKRIFPNFILCEPSLTQPGLLSILRNKEKSKFRDRLVIASASQNDVFNLIDPNTKDYFGTANNGNFFIEFELENPITMNGLHIYASDSYFPQSFDITIDGETVASIKGTKKLNGAGKMMNVIFQQRKGRTVRFTQTGPNLDKGDNFLLFTRFEIQSTDPVYSNGVFATLVQSAENHDPHRCPVYISASFFDFNNFTSIDTKQNICVSGDDPWFQVELTSGFAVLTGFRIKRCDFDKLKRYKIVSTDDSKKAIDSWTTLIEVDEKTEDEHKMFDTYMFPHPSPPSKFVRIIMTGGNWNNDWFLSLFNFDLFGRYF